MNGFKVSMRCLLLTVKVLATDNVKEGTLALVIVAGIQIQGRDTSPTQQELLGQYLLQKRKKTCSGGHKGDP